MRIIGTGERRNYRKRGEENLLEMMGELNWKWGNVKSQEEGRGEITGQSVLQF
jgi:hypothetical protein